MDELSKEYYDTSRIVTQEEAMRNLVSAILLRGVLDYREMLVENISWGDNDCDIRPTASMLEMERFFNNMGFDLHKKLIHGVSQFACIAKNLPEEDYKIGNTNAFICPICGGKVHAAYTRVRTSFSSTPNARYTKVKKCGCRDCQLKMVIE